MADHAIKCHLCGRNDSHGPTRVRNLLVFAFCQLCHFRRGDECDSLMERAAAPLMVSQANADSLTSALCA